MVSQSRKKHSTHEAKNKTRKPHKSASTDIGTKDATTHARPTIQDPSCLPSISETIPATSPQYTENSPPLESEDHEGFDLCLNYPDIQSLYSNAMDNAKTTNIYTYTLPYPTLPLIDPSLFNLPGQAFESPSESHETFDLCVKYPDIQRLYINAFENAKITNSFTYTLPYPTLPLIDPSLFDLPRKLSSLHLPTFLIMMSQRKQTWKVVMDIISAPPV